MTMSQKIVMIRPRYPKPYPMLPYKLSHHDSEMLWNVREKVGFVAAMKFCRALIAQYYMEPCDLRVAKEYVESLNADLFKKD